MVDVDRVRARVRGRARARGGSGSGKGGGEGGSVGGGGCCGVGCWEKQVKLTKSYRGQTTQNCQISREIG